MGFPISYKTQIEIFVKGEDVSSIDLIRYYRSESVNFKSTSVKKLKNRIVFLDSQIGSKSNMPVISEGYVIFDDAAEKILVKVELYFYLWFTLFAFGSIGCLFIPTILWKGLSLASLWAFYFLFYYYIPKEEFLIFFYNALEQFRNGRGIYVKK